MSRDRVFRDPVHGIIQFAGNTRELSRVLDTRVMQRLRHIHQMGFAWLVYPGAEHSRFSHALGAYHIARRVATKLGLDDDTALTLQAAALLHDVGHGPFSHAWEHAFSGLDDISHEHWGLLILQEDTELRAALSQVSADLPQSICNLWKKQFSPSFVRKLVTSQLDVDRLDYLLRDGHYSGAGYASFDLEWILHALTLRPIGPANEIDLVIDYRRGAYAVEQYLFARSYMYAQVYHHKTVRSAEVLFVKLMNRFIELARDGKEPAGLSPIAKWVRGGKLSVADYLGLNDARTTCVVADWADAADDTVIRDLSGRLHSRRLFKSIELGGDEELLKVLAPQALQIATKRFGEHASSYFELDVSRQIAYKRGSEEELVVVDHPTHGTVPLGQLLDMLSLGRPMTTVRLLCAEELLPAMRQLVEQTT